MYSAIVGHADLSSSDLEDVLQRHCQFTRFRGIRHMLNFHPDKPQYSEPTHDNYLTDPVWIKGFGLLEKYNLSFELHVLPRQMHRCIVVYRVRGRQFTLHVHYRSAEVIKRYPNVMVMVDHCGIPYERDEANMKLWREGKAL